jgi:predicted NAD/FAD-binding protein
LKIAIIGTGIAGNVVAYKLNPDHDITVYEAADYIGGHTNTIDAVEDGRRIPIDTGFIVFNDHTYPHFIRLLDEIGQESQPSVMSFSVQAEDGRLEYNGSSLNALFAQRRNVLRPPFYRMIRDILRFNKEAARSFADLDESETLGRFVAKNGYSREFVDHYIVPMAAAIWSAQPGAILEMPIQFLVKFFANHGLMQVRDRPQWRVIKGGSREYVGKLVAGHRDRIRLRTPVRAIKRVAERIDVYAEGAGPERYDFVFLACHSDQALALIADATVPEREVLGAIRYQSNEAVLHTDTTLMPKRRRAWAAWNYHIPVDPRRHVAVTYNMNMLQSLACKQQYCVTLNNVERIDPRCVLRRIAYDHPVYSRQTVAAQRRQTDLNTDRTFFCGAYWRNGFHEDGVVSALDALTHFEERLTNGKLRLQRAS